VHVDVWEQGTRHFGVDREQKTMRVAYNDEEYDKNTVLGNMNLF
jgi:hypothetical protein